MTYHRSPSFDEMLEFGRPSKYRSLLVILTLVSLLLFAHSTTIAQETVTLVGSGSTVPAPLYAAWIREYNKRNPHLQIQYLPVGTSEGIDLVSKGSGDFGAGEVLLTAADRKTPDLRLVPTALVAIVPIYNLPSVHENLRLSGTVLAEVFLGEIRNWNDMRIARINPELSLPDLSIKVVVRPAGKGSNFIFTDYLSKVSHEFRAKIGCTASPAWKVGVPAERSSDVADMVKAQPGAIGYVDLSYAIKGDIRFALVQNAAGRYVKASHESLYAAYRAHEKLMPDSTAASLTNPIDPEAYPITSMTWFYLRNRYPDAGRSKALDNWLAWILDDGQEMAAREGYTKLPPSLLSKLRARLSRTP